ncbi:MAG: MBL fold metallo-hydrolase [Clostridiaceae bacterium]
MKLTVLTDNNSLIDRYFLAEPALCFLIEEGGKKVLFDTGYSDVFIKNANKMNIKLTDIDAVVLSHGHIDHTGGLHHLISIFMEEVFENRTMEKPDLICHEDTFKTKLIPDGINVGSPVKEEQLNVYFNLKMTKDPVWITDKLVYLGGIPRLNNFENKKPIGDDYVLDDSAIVWKSANGLVIITGCSHSGICNIVEHAKTVCKEDKVIDIIGGFHLLNPSREQLDGTIECLAKLKPKNIYACHCTDLKSKIALSKAVNIMELGVGMKLEYREVKNG